MWRRTLESIYFGATLAGQPASKFDCYILILGWAQLFSSSSDWQLQWVNIYRPFTRVRQEVGEGIIPATILTHITLSPLQKNCQYNSCKLPNNNNKKQQRNNAGQRQEVGEGIIPAIILTHITFSLLQKILSIQLTQVTQQQK